MPRKKAAAGAQPTERKRKKVEKMPEGTFAVKLRAGPITEGHMNRLAQMKGLKARKCTRKVMQAHLLGVVNAELARILTLPTLVAELAPVVRVAIARTLVRTGEPREDGVLAADVEAAAPRASRPQNPA